MTMDCNGCENVSRVKMHRQHGRVSGRVSRRSVRMKVKKLQKLIPGGQGLKPDRLFLRTADYILHLKLQVDVLQALSKIYKP
ncbi:transcription factor PAR1-like [Cornus florida]|uniref:transcription factor PAR1-like n=1 Tax=Cornus florida TaxID=4283 RepID=UPI0028A1B345|nr:transcription factor PAR1-like [Cornus florida]